MKTLILGDIHGRTCWKEIMERENPDLTIFLGDYVSTHEDISSQQQIDNLIEILSYKESHMNSVILLRGNHDVQHLVGNDMCSGYNKDVFEWMQKNKDRFMELTQWVYEDEDIVFSHAGISKVWFDNHRYEAIEEINQDRNLMNFEFSPSKMSDYYGDSATQPPTWIRPLALAENAIPNKVYVVGHTPVNSGICELRKKLEDYQNDSTSIETYIFGIMNKNDVKIWLCDALPQEYLIIENRQFTVKKNLSIT